MTPLHHRLSPLLAAVALVLALTPLSLWAHEIIVEHVVEMTLSPQRDRLMVTLHVPAAVAGDPTLHALAGSPFHRVMKQEFDQVWSDSATLFRAEPRRGPRHAMPTAAPANTNLPIPNEPLRAPTAPP